MAQLSVYLPPFAGDYSGAAGMLFGMDAAVVIVDASCCTRNYTGYDEPRWSSKRKSTFCAQLRTMESVLGDDTRLLSQTEDIAANLDSPCIVLLGTPVPALVGMDLAGMALDLEGRCARPVLGVSTTGFDTYELGASLVQLELLRKFCAAGCHQDAKEASRVNILGACIQDFGSQEVLDKLTQAACGEGLGLAWNTAGDYAMEDVASAASAAKSHVVSWSGLAAARYLEREFGVPYEVGVPAEALRALPGVSALLEAVGGGEAKDELLIVHDQVIAHSVRELLRTQGYCGDIKVASLFSMDDTLAQEGDFHIQGEMTLATYVQEHPHLSIVGDPLLARVPGVQECLRCMIYHEAVSSNLFKSDGSRRQ